MKKHTSDELAEVIQETRRNINKIEELVSSTKNDKDDEPTKTKPRPEPTITWYTGV